MLALLALAALAALAALDGPGAAPVPVPVPALALAVVRSVRAVARADVVGWWWLAGWMAHSRFCAMGSRGLPPAFTPLRVPLRSQHPHPPAYAALDSSHRRRRSQQRQQR